MSQQIDPERVYSFSQARHFIRSRGGGPLSLGAMYRWKNERRFEAICDTHGGKRYWFIRGRELLRLIEKITTVIPAAEPNPLTRTELDNWDRWTEIKLKEHGIQ